MMRTTLERGVGLIRSLHGWEIEFVVFWVDARCILSVGNKPFGGRTASIFRVEVRHQEDVSTALSSQRCSWIVIQCFHGNNQKNHEFYGVGLF